MAALDFPSSPTVGTIYSANGGRWKWDGVVWVVDNLYNLDNITDVVITTPTDNQTLTYDAASETWINETVAATSSTAPIWAKTFMLMGA